MCNKWKICSQFFFLSNQLVMLNIMNLWGTLAMHIFLLQHWQSTDLIGKHGIMQRNFFFYFCLYMIHLYALHVLLSLNKFSITLQIPRKHYLVIKEVDCMPIQLERQRFQKGNIIRHHLWHKKWKTADKLHSKDTSSHIETIWYTNADW